MQSDILRKKVLPGKIRRVFGGQPENYAEWKEVYSEKGGQYRMTVQYTQGAGRQLELTVNGEKQVLKQLGDDNGLRTVTFR